MHRPLERGVGRDLERETALARSARPRDGHESDVGLVQERLDSLQRIRAADKPVMEGREARRSERFQRRELVLEARGAELKELRCNGDVLEAMPTQRSVRRSGYRRFPRHVPRRCRDDDLLAVRRRADA
jgi:hypothetical protein